MAVLGIHPFHYVKRDGVVSIRRVKVDDVVHSRGRNKMENLFCGFSVRVYKSHAVPTLNILYGHILEHLGLAHARLSHGIKMATPVVQLNPKLLLGIPEVRYSEEINLAHKELLRGQSRRSFSLL